MTIARIAYPKAHLIAKSGVYPLGFKAGSVITGVKKNGRKDLAMITSDRPCTASGVFTLNAFCAAPVKVSKEILKLNRGSGINGVLVNSGCANACTVRFEALGKKRFTI